MICCTRGKASGLVALGSSKTDLLVQEPKVTSAESKRSLFIFMGPVVSEGNKFTTIWFPRVEMHEVDQLLKAPYSGVCIFIQQWLPSALPLLVGQRKSGVRQPPPVAPKHGGASPKVIAVGPFLDHGNKRQLPREMHGFTNGLKHPAQLTKCSSQGLSHTLRSQTPYS